MSEIAVKVEDLWKRYAIGHKKSSSFRESIGQWFSKSEADYFWALKELNFEIKRGEAVGIIGKNGAGKSTLLKVLSKITYPTKGRIEINGRVSSLLEVGTGFHPELSGRQNVYLNGTILGMTRREITAKFDEIVAFSGVEKFIDTPVKHYSSGMKVRLAFSVAAHLEPEILIIDEVLAVGDAEFQKKCLGKMEDVTGEGRTVIFVSHNMGAVKSLCSKGVVIEKGLIEMVGSVSEALQSYLEQGRKQDHVSGDLTNHLPRKGNGNFRFVKLGFNQKGRELDFGKQLIVHVEIKKSIKDDSMNRIVDFGLAVVNRDQYTVTHLSNRFIDKKLALANDLTILELTIGFEMVSPGDYSLTLFLRINGEIEDWISDVGYFKVLEGNPYGYSNTQEINGAIMPTFTIKEK
jgi:lipopolysaccharide transport system ATP-binding protein